MDRCYRSKEKGIGWKEGATGGRMTGSREGATVGGDIGLKFEAEILGCW